MRPTRTFKMERIYDASIEDVWALWTAREGFESWWGPDGFDVKVRRLDLRPGGELIYDMTASALPQIQFMQEAGMALTAESRITYTEIVAMRLLAYTHLADFIPGVVPYNIATTVEFQPSASSVRMVVTVDAMHDQEWTRRASMGWKSQLGKLAKVLNA